MWIGVQIIIFILLVVIAFVLPEKVYTVILGLGIIFTIFAVFANWLLVVQILNILIAGAVGNKIIEKRDKLFKSIYRDVLRIDEDGNKVKVEEASKRIIITRVCAVLIIILKFCNIYYSAGEFEVYFVSPLEWFGYFSFVNILRCIDLFGIVLLLYYAWTCGKRTAEDFIKPAFINMVVIVIFALKYCFNLGFYYGGSVYAFEVFTYLYIFILLILVIKNTLKSRVIIVFGSLIPVIIALILTFHLKNPFINYYGNVMVSYLLSFIAYCVGYGALMSTLKKIY